MADALISTPVATVAGIVSVALILVAANKAKNSKRTDNVALMGVMGAFVFAAQMINFSIPGTGSSGHIIGGILLAAMLGPWAAFLTLCSVLIVQCLVFADGGLLALGCNIVNMAAMSCLVAYPLIFRPMTERSFSAKSIMWASALACTAGLELGALLVCVETVMSGVTALPIGKFLLFMLPIHLVIGICEGVATGLVLLFVRRNDISLLTDAPQSGKKRKKLTSMIVSFAVAAAVLAVSFYWIASGSPDGLEWSIFHVTGSTELAPAAVPSTAFMADYGSRMSGIIGGLIVMAVLWGTSVLVFHRTRHATT